ncbi:MAG: FAD-binding protein, partial [Kiloniellales bacterium]
MAEAIAWALAEEQPLEVLGRGSKRGLGRPLQTAPGLGLGRLELIGLTGITLYEPEELVLSARAGTPLAEIEAALAEKRQALAFEPPDLGPLLGGKAGQGSLGGAMACNLAGPRRFKAGAARDHLLGFRAISGRGEAFKSGGRVVKNVTGYDLSKLMAGSHGTLAALTEVTVKVLPAAEAEATLALRGLDDMRALAAMTTALVSPLDPSGAAHLPAAAAAKLTVDGLSGSGALTALRLEGPQPSVAARAEALTGLLGKLGTATRLEAAASRALWQAVRDVHPFVGAKEAQVWRVSLPPQAAVAFAATLSRLAVLGYFYDWGGGLVWLALPAAERDAHQR